MAAAAARLLSGDSLGDSLSLRRPSRVTPGMAPVPSLAPFERAFRTWINYVIADHTDYQVTAPMWESLSDGFALAHLAEAILARKGQIVKQLKPNPQFRIQKNTNVKIVLDELAAGGYQLSQASGLEFRPEDITDGDQKQISDFLWGLFERVALEPVIYNELSGKEALLAWVKENVSHYPNAPTEINLKDSFYDGYVLCFLLHKYSAKALSLSQLSETSPTSNVAYALRSAQTAFGVPPLITVEDVCTSDPDERLLLLYLTVLYSKLASLQASSIRTRQVVRLISFVLANERLRQQYGDCATQLADFLSNKTEQLQRIISVSPEGIQEAETFLENFRTREKDAARTVLQGVESSEYQLRIRLQAYKRPPFQPPAAIAKPALLERWSKLHIAELQYECSLEIAHGKHDLMQLLCTQFAEAVNEFGDWAVEAYKRLDELQLPKLLPDIFAKDRELRQLRSAVTSREVLMEELRAMHGTAVGQGHTPVARFSIEDVESIWSELQAALTEAIQSLEAHLGRAIEACVLQQEYGANASAFMRWMSRAVRPLQDNQAVQKSVVLQALRTFHEMQQQQQAELRRLKEIERKMNEAGFPYQQQQDQVLSVQDIDALFQDLRELATRRETELSHELAADEMTSDYRQLGQVLSDWMIEQSRELPRLLKAQTVEEAERYHAEFLQLVEEQEKRVAMIQTLQSMAQHLDKYHSNSSADLQFQGLRERWEEFVKLLERTGPQTRIRIELLTAATQEREVFTNVAGDCERVLSSVAAAVQRARTVSDLREANMELATLHATRRQLRDVVPRFVTLVRSHGTILIAETAKEHSSVITSRLAALCEQWNSAHHTVELALRTAARQVTDLSTKKVQQERYTGLLQTLTAWVVLANTEVGPISSLTAVFELAQTVAYRSPAFDELRHLSHVLFGAEDVKLVDIQGQYTGLCAALEQRATDVTQDVTSRPTAPQKYAAMAEHLYDWMEAASTQLSSLTDLQWTVPRDFSNLEAEAADVQQSLTEMSALMDALYEVHADLVAQGVTIVADPQLTPDGLQDRLRALMAMQQAVQQRLREGHERVDRAADLRSRYDKEAQALLELCSQQRNALTQPVVCRSLEEAKSALSALLESMGEHSTLFARYDTLARTAQLLSDPLVPAALADIPLETEIEAVHAAVLLVRELSEHRRGELSAAVAAFEQLHMLRERAMRNGQLIIRWLERTDRLLLEAATVDSVGDALAVQDQLQSLQAERGCISTVMAELSTLVAVLTREQLADGLPDAGRLAMDYKEAELRIAAAAEAVQRTVRRAMARNQLMYETTAGLRLLERSDEWLQLPMFAAPEDPTLYSAERTRLQEALMQLRAQRDALALAQERVSTAQHALEDAVAAAAPTAASHSATRHSDADAKAIGAAAEFAARRARADESLVLRAAALERADGSGAAYESIRTQYRDAVAAVLSCAEREQVLLAGLAPSGTVAPQTWAELEHAEQELRGLQLRLRVGEQQLQTARQLYPRLAAAGAVPVCMPLPVVEAALEAVTQAVPVLAAAVQAAQQNIKKREQLERELGQRVRALEAWLAEAEATLHQVDGASTGAALDRALSAARSIMSQQRVRGFELAHIQRLEVQLLALTPVDAPGPIGPSPTAAVAARYEAWRRDGRAVLRRLEDEAAEAAAVAELRTQIEQRAAAILEWLRTASPAIATLPVGGGVPDLRAQDMRLQFWQQQRADLQRQLADLQALHARLSTPGALRSGTVSLAALSHGPLPPGAAGTAASAPLPLSREAGVLSEVATQWRQLEGEFDQKQSALLDAKQRLMQTARLSDAYEREHDTLAVWLADERRELIAALSLPVDMVPRVLSSFRARKVEQGIPIMDRLQEMHVQLMSLQGNVDDADLKVAEDAWDVLLLLAEAVEQLCNARAQRAAQASELHKQYMAEVAPLTDWLARAETILQSLSPLRESSRADLQATLSHLVALWREMEPQAAVLRIMGQLEARLREQGARPPRGYPTIKELATLLSDVHSRVEAAVGAALGALETALRLEDMVGVYRLRSQHFIQWCAMQRVAVDVRGDSLSAQAAAEEAIGIFERERAVQQQRLSDLQTLWSTLESSPGADIRLLTPAAELAGTLRELVWLVGQRTSRLDAMREQREYQAALALQWLDVCGQVLPWVANALISLALFRFGTTLEDVQACQRELQDFSTQQQSAAATFSFLHQLLERILEPGPAVTPPATPLLTLLDQNLSVCWDELTAVVQARTGALAHAAGRLETVAQMRERYLDEAHALHPLLQRLLPTADRLSRVDWGTAPASGPDAADLRSVALSRAEVVGRLRSLQRAEAVLALFGTQGLASGFLSAEDIVSRWHHLAELVESCRSAHHNAGVDARRRGRVRDTVTVMLTQLSHWVQDALAALQDVERAIPADPAGRDFDAGVATVTRILCERELRQSVWRRLVALRPAVLDEELARLRADMDRLGDLLSAVQRRLAAVIDARMAMRQKWGRFVGLYSLVTDYLDRTRTALDLAAAGGSGRGSGAAAGAAGGSDAEGLPPSDATTRLEAMLRALDAENPYVASLMPELNSLDAELGPREDGLSVQLLQQRLAEYSAALTDRVRRLKGNETAAEGARLVAEYEQIASSLVEWSMGIYRSAPDFLLLSDDDSLAKSAALYKEIQERIPHLSEDYQRAVAKLQEVHACRLGEQVNPSLSLELVHAHLAVIGALRKWMDTKMVVAVSVGDVQSLRAQHIRMADEMMKRLNEIQLEFSSAHESARRAAEAIIQRRRAQRGEGGGTSSGLESSDDTAEIRVSKLAEAFQRLLDEVLKEDQRFTSICLIDLKLLEANLAVTEPQYHPVELRKRWSDVYNEVNAVLKELRDKADLQYRLQTSNLDSLVLAFIEEADAFCNALRLENDYHALLKVQMDVRVIRVRNIYYESRLRLFLQMCEGAGFDDRAEALQQRWAALQERLTALPSEELLQQRIKEVYAADMQRIEFDGCASGVRDWAERAKRFLDLTTAKTRTARAWSMQLAGAQLIEGRDATVERRMERLAALQGPAATVTQVAAARDEARQLADRLRAEASAQLEEFEKRTRMAEEYTRGALEVQRWLRERDMALSSLLLLDSINLVDALVADLKSAMAQLKVIREKHAALGPMYRELKEAGGPLPHDPSLTPEAQAELLRPIETRLEKRREQLDSELQKRIEVKAEYNVTMEQLQEYTEVFDFFDQDHSGTIDREELSHVMLALGEFLGEKQLDAVFEEFDTDGNGTLDFEEFVRVLKVYYKPVETIDDYLALFVQMADRPGGVLTLRRLRQALETSLTAAEMEQLLTLVKVRPSGSVDYAGLVAMLFEL